MAIGLPIRPMVLRVKRWLSEGRDVRIFTARVDGGEAASLVGIPEKVVSRFRNVAEVRSVIERWCYLYLGRVLPITNIKDFAMTELWDDRAIQVLHNKGKRVETSQKRFKFE